MADAEREARIKLTTQADLAGAKEFNRELAELEKAMQKGDAASKESARATEDLARKKGALKDALKGLAFEFPVLARAIGFITNPLTLLTAALGVAGGALLNWKSKIEETSREQRRLDSIGDSVDSVARNLARFTSDAAKSEAAFKAIASGADTAGTAIEKLNTALAVTQRRQDELADKEMGLFNANVDEMVKSGQISEAEGVELKIAAEQKARTEKQQRDIQTQALQVFNLQRGLMQVDQELETADKGPTPEVLAQLKRNADLAAEQAAKSKRKFDEIEDATDIDKLEEQAGRPMERQFLDVFTDPTLLVFPAADRFTEAQQQLSGARAAKEASQTVADQAAARYQAALDAKNAAGRRRETLLNRRNQFAQQLESANAVFTAQQSFDQQANVLDAAIDDVRIAGARREQRQQATQSRARENAQVNQALTGEFARRDLQDLLGSLLQLQEQNTQATRAVLIDFREKFREINARLNDLRRD